MSRSSVKLRDIEQLMHSSAALTKKPDKTAAVPAKRTDLRRKLAAVKAGAPVAGSAGVVRIVGGVWRRRKLPVADRPGLRPTPDRVRETLFNWLGQDLGGWRCADVFAGTGALGFEAASRGAADVLMVEADAELCAQLKQIVEQLGAEQVRVVRGDGPQLLSRVAADSLDLVFVDPPFAQGPLFDAALRAAAQAVRLGGWIYLESPQAWSPEALSSHGLQSERTLQAGAVHAHLLQRIQ